MISKPPPLPPPPPFAPFYCSDVLGAPTEDQVDVGSSVVGWNDNNENARTARQRYCGRGAGAGAGASSSSAGVPASFVRKGAMPRVDAAAAAAAAATRTGNTMTFETVLKVRP